MMAVFKIMKKYWMAVVMLTCCITSCTKENEENLKNQLATNTCDTVNMSYSLNVLPIIQANCYSCHGNGTITAGINLDGYLRLKRQVDNNNLVNVINHNAGYPQMPFGKAKLAQCDINKIMAWVNRGAPDN